MILVCALDILFVRPGFPSDRGPRLLEESTRSKAEKPRRDIRVDVDLILVPVTVTDRTGKAITGLQREQFQLSEDGIPQQIVSLSNEDAPISVGIVFDLSGSMAGKRNKAAQAVHAFLETLNPEDEVMLVTFADRPQLDLAFTSDASDVESALLAAKSGGSTSLNDAICLALLHMKSATRSRKALLIVSDGGDNYSRYSEKELRTIALESDVQMHAIGIHDNPRGREEMSGPFLLEGLTKLTGGLHVTVRSLNELAPAAEKIGYALHDQYVLCYYPNSGSLQGKHRRIRVKLVLPGGYRSLQVRSRTGYYSPDR
jgi:Ca-activated chloride channel family protein